MVGIKDMKMPKNCAKCKLFHSYLDLDGLMHCICKYGDVEMCGNLNAKRNDICPLIEEVEEMNEECNKVCRELVTEERLYEKLNAAIRRSEITIAKGEAMYDTLMDVKRGLDQYFEDLNLKEKVNEPVKISIPYLMHKELDAPLLECQKAYDVAIEYLRNKANVEC